MRGVGVGVGQPAGQVSGRDAADGSLLVQAGTPAAARVGTQPADAVVGLGRGVSGVGVGGRGGAGGGGGRWPCCRRLEGLKQPPFTWIFPAFQEVFSEPLRLIDLDGASDAEVVWAVAERLQAWWLFGRKPPPDELMDMVTALSRVSDALDTAEMFGDSEDDEEDNESEE